MKIKANHLCRCGHRAAAHTSGVFPDQDPKNVGVPLKIIQDHQVVYGCGKCRVHKGSCTKFQLPNLDYIEYLAKQKGLL